MPPVAQIFSWVGLALGGGVRRFHNNIYMFPNPTEIWYFEYIASTLQYGKKKNIVIDVLNSIVPSTPS